MFDDLFESTSYDDIMLDDSYATESFDLFDDSYGYAMESPIPEKTSFGTKVKNLLIRFKNWVASFLKNIVSVLVGSKDGNGVTVHRSIITFIKDMLTAAKKDAENHYNAKHNSNFLGDYDIDFDIELAIENLNYRFEIITEEALEFSEYINSLIALEAINPADVRIIDTKVKSLLSDITETKNKAIEEAKTHGDSESLKSLIKGYDDLIAELEAFVKTAKEKFKDNKNLSNNFGKTLNDATANAKKDKSEIDSEVKKYNAAVKSKTAEGIYKVENVQSVGGREVATYMTNSGKSLIAEADSLAKNVVSEGNKNSGGEKDSSEGNIKVIKGVTAASSGQSSAAASTGSFFSNLLKKFSIFLGTLSRFFKYTWNGILCSIKIRRAERILANAKQNLYSDNDKMVTRAKTMIDEANSKKSAFLGRVAQESYNEGYNAALEDLGIAEEGLFPSKEMRAARTESKKFFKEAGNYANQAQNALKSGDTKAYKAYYTKAITSLKKAKACLIDGDKYAKKYEELIESWSWLRENPTK